MSYDNLLDLDKASLLYKLVSRDFNWLMFIASIMLLVMGIVSLVFILRADVTNKDRNVSIAVAVALALSGICGIYFEVSDYIGGSKSLYFVATELEFRNYCGLLGVDYQEGYNYIVSYYTDKGYTIYDGLDFK